jgi:hypothetical protein
MATVSTGDESTGPKSRRQVHTSPGSAPSHGWCARPTPGREATSNPNVSTAEVCSATAEVCSATAEVCSAAAEVCSATAEVCSATTEVRSATTGVRSATAAAMVLRGSIGSERHSAKRDDCGQCND